jgi:hypothetical protein
VESRYSLCRDRGDGTALSASELEIRRKAKSSDVTNSHLPIFWPAGRAQVLQQPSGDVASLIACHRADVPMTRIRHEEQTICTLYDHKQFKCRKCGCLMSIKPWLRSAKCPDNPPRWYGTVKTGRPLARQTRTAR